MASRIQLRKEACATVEKVLVVVAAANDPLLVVVRLRQEAVERGSDGDGDTLPSRDKWVLRGTTATTRTRETMRTRRL